LSGSRLWPDLLHDKEWTCRAYLWFKCVSPICLRPLSVLTLASDRECCGQGCCREGWKCGRNEMCYPPHHDPPPPQQTNCFTTIITVVKPIPVHPTTDTEISGIQTDETETSTSKGYGIPSDTTNGPERATWATMSLVSTFRIDTWTIMLIRQSRRLRSLKRRLILFQQT
jgi:hypothetical protein